MIVPELTGTLTLLYASQTKNPEFGELMMFWEVENQISSFRKLSNINYRFFLIRLLCSVYLVESLSLVCATCAVCSATSTLGITVLLDKGGSYYQ